MILTADIALEHSSGLLALSPSAFGSRLDLLPPGESPPAPKVGTQVAVMSIFGPLSQRTESHLCGTSLGYDTIAAQFGALMADPEVGSVVLEISSPGGDAAGCFEAVRAMRAAKTKPVFAYASELAASAAYALATVADKIFLPSTGEVGSVGVLSVHVERSKQLANEGITPTIIRSGKAKADANPLEPLTEAAHARIQARVDAMASEFFALVKEARGMDPRSLEGATFTGADAIRVGLADGVKSFTEVVTMAADTGEKARRAQAFAALGEKLSAVAPELADVSVEEAAGIVTAWRASAANVTTMADELAAMKLQEVERFNAMEAIEREQLLRSAVAAGKVSPAEAFPDGAMAEDFAAMSLDMLRTHLVKRPVVLGTVKAAHVTHKFAANVTDVELRSVQERGLDAAQYAETKARLFGGVAPTNTEG